MELNEAIAELSQRIRKQKKGILTEEAVKTAFILPFIQALGYDIFNPAEIVPEFTADHGVKKGEKVDYAIKLNNEVVMLLECKPIGSELAAKHASQLYRYFSVTDTKISILTDGIKYLFYSDIEKENRMDERCFFEFDICSYQKEHIDLLKKFSKSLFSIKDILLVAVDLKYSKSLHRIVAQEFHQPSATLVKYLTSQVYCGRFTPQIKAKFEVLVTQALKDFLRFEVNQRLEMALDKETVEFSSHLNQELLKKDKNKSELSTTTEELESCMIIRAICTEIVNPTQIALRDALTYCAILFNDNNRKPIARLYYKKTKMSIGIFIGSIEKRFDIQSTTDIFLYKRNIIDSIQFYISEKVKP